MKKENRTVPGTELYETRRRTLKEATFINLKIHASSPLRKEKLSPTSKAKRKASRNKVV